MKLYVASSWRNTLYTSTTALLREAGHDILDWRQGGFGWHECVKQPPTDWTPRFYRDIVLTQPRAQEGFANDYDKMCEADACVLLLPCGRSAHLEAGWFWGKDKPVHIYIPVFDEPELMYLGAGSISFTIEELLAALDKPQMVVKSVETTTLRGGCSHCGYYHPPDGMCV